MSHAHGEVIKDGKIIGHYEYDGTADIVWTKIRATTAEVWAHWRTAANRAKCTCEKPEPVKVILYSSYGNGFHWPGKICEICQVIVDGIGKYDIDSIPGHPTEPDRDEWSD